MTSLVPRFVGRGKCAFILYTTTFLALFASSLPLHAAAGPKSFDLSADIAENSLREFAAQSGTEVVFATSTSGKVRTNAVKGRFTPREALNRMVANTSLIVVEHAKTGALVIHNSAAPNQPSTKTNPSTKKKTPQT
jgi:iron complex outermembrane recepter protein